MRKIHGIRPQGTGNNLKDNPACVAIIASGPPSYSLHKSSLTMAAFVVWRSFVGVAPRPLPARRYLP